MSLSDINPQIDPGSDAPVKKESTISESTQANASTLKDTVVNSEYITNNNVETFNLTLFPFPDASAAANAIQNHPITQNVTNGPVAQSVKKEAAQTSNEFGGLANSRQKPDYTAQNGEELTHYHSFFYTLLSWKHPRATGITFGASVAFIFACRYLPVLKWILKGTYLILGVVTLAELSGKLVMGSSVAGSIRPRRYFKIPKESLEASLDDLEHLINFFVIEFQRVVFAENVPVTAAAFISAFISYYLIKILPFWGLALLSTCVVYLAPLVYVSNKELIDGQLDHASKVIGEQTAQVRDLTAQHTSQGIETLKKATSEYTSKASELVGSARQKIPTPAGAPAKSVNANDFPSAPQTDLPSTAGHTKPVVNAPSEGEPIAASSI